MNRVVRLVAAAALAGCSGTPSGTTSCTITVTSGSVSATECLEYFGLSSDMLQQSEHACGSTDGGAVSASGTWATTPCSRSGAAGGCRVNSNLTVWYYGADGGVGQMTPQSVQAGCAVGGGTYVMP